MEDTGITAEEVIFGSSVLEDVAKDKPNGKDKASLVYIVPYGAVSFEDVEEYTKSQIAGERVQELTRIYQDLIWNVMFNDEIEDKTTAMNSLTKEFNNRVSDVIAAGASGVGLVDGVLQFFKDKFVPKEEKQEPKENGLMIWKDGERYRWASIFTNKYRDEDLPPEILSEAAHEEFVKAVEKGEEPYPELWHWHTPGTRWGITDVLHYDKSTGFMVASGWIDNGHEKEAEAVLALEEPIKTSHGMPQEFIKREDEDKSVITNYVSREISDLPARYAANQLTGFNIIKEVDENMIPEEKKAYFRSVGMAEDTIEALEADMGAKAKEAEGLEFKEAEVEVEAVLSPEEIAEAEVVDLTEEAPAYATREEVAEAIVETVQPIAEAVTAIAEGMKELRKSDEAKIAEVSADIPAASIGAIIAKQWSVIGTDKAKVDGRTSEAKDGPDETDPIKERTGIGFIDTMLAAE